GAEAPEDVLWRYHAVPHRPLPGAARTGDRRAAGPGRAILPARRREGSPRRRRRLTRDGASLAPRRAPVLSAPPCRKPTPPPPRDDPDAARQPELPVPPLPPSGRRLKPHHQHQIRGAVCARGARERDAEPTVRARAALPRRAQQELRGGGESHAGPSLVGPACRPQGEPRQTGPDTAGDPQLHA